MGRIIIIGPMNYRPNSKQAIINADDFGFSPSVTDGILRAHRQGVVTSTTVMTNAPDAERSVSLLAEAPELGVGVHLNASQGACLSAEGRAALAGADGEMHYTATGLIIACTLRPKLLRAIEAEFDAQIRWLLDCDITPTHLDTHRHCHGHAPIFARVVKLAKRYHIPFVRRHRERLPGGGWPEAPAKQKRTAAALNALSLLQRLTNKNVLTTTGTWGVAHTGCISAAWLMLAAQRLPTGVTEIMCHPGTGDSDNTNMESRLAACRAGELAALCDPAVKEAFAHNDVELTHYGKL